MHYEDNDNIKMFGWLLKLLKRRPYKKWRYFTWEKEKNL